MRALIMVRPARVFPAEQLVDAAQAFRDWRAQYRSQLELFAWYADGSGGCAIANVASEIDLFRIMLDYPFTPYQDIESQVLIDGDDALSIWSEAIATRHGRSS